MSQRYHKYTSLTNVADEKLQNSTLVFDVEEALLKSSSVFSYFMLVAFEGGGPLRALILLIFYPLLCIIGESMRLKVMVFICFFGIKKDKFKIGSTVLPKFFLQNVGHKGLEVVRKFGRRVGVSKLPRVMVESFLVDYLGVQDIVGEEIKDFGGYYLGLVENIGVEEIMPKEILSNTEVQVTGIIGDAMKSLIRFPFTYCKDIYLVSKDDKINWKYLPRDKYPKPLLFHDSRLVFEPTPLASLILFIWLPFGIILCIFRVLFSLLPFRISALVLASMGVSYTLQKPCPSNNEDANKKDEKVKGVVYVCNHRSVLDPVYVSLVLQTNLPALTYSVSKFTAIISPIKTINLTRDKEKDANIMREALRKGSLVVCPEGTTCREPCLLRFSPMFAEICDNIIPVAIEVKNTMFYGTTATGNKAWDPFVNMLNPRPYCHVRFLEKLPKGWTCGGGGMSKFDVANYVQAELGKALGYTCTSLTRRDKYAILAGTDGLVNKSR